MRRWLQYVRPEVSGEILFGNSDLAVLEPADPDACSNTATGSFQDMAVGKVAARFPRVGNASIASTYAGCYDVTPDFNPVISATPVPGLICAAGFSGHGFKISPAVGALVADFVVDGRSAHPDIPEADFRLSRFAEGALLRSRTPTSGPGDAVNGPADHGPATREVDVPDPEDGRLERAIAAQVRRLRQAAGLTLAEPATRSGISKPMLSKLENAQTSCSLTTLARLADTLDVPATSLFRGADAEREAVHTPAGAGARIVQRGTRVGHDYTLLGALRGPHKRMEAHLVTLTERSKEFPLFQHPGTELLYMLEGEMVYSSTATAPTAPKSSCACRSASSPSSRTAGPHPETAHDIGAAPRHRRVDDRVGASIRYTRLTKPGDRR